MPHPCEICSICQACCFRKEPRSIDIWKWSLDLGFPRTRWQNKQTPCGFTKVERSNTKRVINKEKVSYWTYSVRPRHIQMTPFQGKENPLKPTIQKTRQRRTVTTFTCYYIHRCWFSGRPKGATWTTSAQNKQIPYVQKTRITDIETTMEQTNLLLATKLNYLGV